MKKVTGVFTTTKKDGSLSYRSSITIRGKHISLGSFSKKELAMRAYEEAKHLCSFSTAPEDYNPCYALSYSKYISLINYRDNKLYFPTPIYLRSNYFEYHISPSVILKFDRDDLFFCASHTIQQRKGYLFYSDYGSQYKLLGRYGVKPYAVYGKDYAMANGDVHDYRYSNIRIMNHYMGVSEEKKLSDKPFLAQIHIVGNYIIGRYKSETDAAIAYNKAVDTLHANGVKKAYIKNYIMSYDKSTYLERYSRLRISKNITSYQRTTQEAAAMHHMSQHD